MYTTRYFCRIVLYFFHNIHKFTLHNYLSLLPEYQDSPHGPVRRGVGGASTITQDTIWCRWQAWCKLMYYCACFEETNLTNCSFTWVHTHPPRRMHALLFFLRGPIKTVIFHLPAASFLTAFHPTWERCIKTPTVLGGGCQTETSTSSSQKWQLKDELQQLNNFAEIIVMTPDRFLPKKV